MSNNITKSKWSRGITLITSYTRSWPQSKIDENNKTEASMIFQGFDSADNGRSRKLICTLNRNHENYEANAQAIASLPDIMRENEELKAQCESYKKDYESMVKEVLRLSGENSKMKEALCDLIKVSEESTRDIVAFENADILDNCIDKAKALISK